MTRKLLLYAGLASSLLYLATVIFSPVQWPGFDAYSQNERLHSLPRTPEPSAAG